MRGFVVPGESADDRGQPRSRRLGLCHDRSEDPGRRQAARATPRSRSALIPFPNPDLRGHMDAWPSVSAFRTRPSPMTETQTESFGGSLDHRHRSCHFARRRARRQLGRAQCATHQCRREGLCALHRAPLGPDQSRRPDSEEGRSAPDGSLAADRHLCRRAGAGFGRRQGQRGNPGADGHGRRRRRRRARSGGRFDHPEPGSEGQFGAPAFSTNG